MNSPRLLPIVIFAAVALLVFKGIGIVTDGGYVLAGIRPAQAADAAPDSGLSVDNAAPRTEPTMSDTSPTLDDTSPTLAIPASPGSAQSASGSAQSASGSGNAQPAAVAQAGAAPASGTTSATATTGAAPAANDPAAPAVPADASAMQVNNAGQVVPVTPGGDSSAAGNQVLQRLSQRRVQLDQLQSDLSTREAIVKAAETQLTQRSDALKALQAQIASLQQRQQASQGQDMGAIVKLYDNMKPQDAAGIFDGLDMNVLVHVAKAMDPRKMSPILAKMTPQKAQELTTQLAAGDLGPPPSVSSVAATDPNALPQIVGH